MESNQEIKGLCRYCFWSPSFGGDCSADRSLLCVHYEPIEQDFSELAEHEYLDNLLERVDYYQELVDEFDE